MTSTAAWNGGGFHDYDREHCVDLMQFAAFCALPSRWPPMRWRRPKAVRRGTHPDAETDARPVP